MNMISARCECKQVMNFGLNSVEPVVFTIECGSHKKAQDCDSTVDNGSGSHKTIQCMEHARW